VYWAYNLDTSSYFFQFICSDTKKSFPAQYFGCTNKLNLIASLYQVSTNRYTLYAIILMLLVLHCCTSTSDVIITP
jgi:hypothetical protein